MQLYCPALVETVTNRSWKSRTAWRSGFGFEGTAAGELPGSLAEKH